METKITNGETGGAGGYASFSPDEYLITTLRRASAHRQDISIVSEPHGTLLLLSSRGEYFFTGPDIEALLCQSPERCRITILSPGDSRIPGPETIGRNIDELMWQAAFYPAQGRCLEGCHRDDVIRLEFWPNLTRLPHTPNTFRILALIAQHPTSVFFAARLLKVPQGEMAQLYSAGRTAGCIRVINRTPEEPDLRPHRNQTLLSSLLAKIARR